VLYNIQLLSCFTGHVSVSYNIQLLSCFTGHVSVLYNIVQHTTAVMTGKLL